MLTEQSLGWKFFNAWLIFSSSVGNEGPDHSVMFTFKCRPKNKSQTTRNQLKLVHTGGIGSKTKQNLTLSRRHMEHRNLGHKDTTIVKAHKKTRYLKPGIFSHISTNKGNQEYGKKN